MQQHAPARKILIVDDNEDIRRVIDFALRGYNYELYKAADGASALKLCESQTPEIVILDIQMPGDMDGIEVCRRLHEQSGGRPQVIMISALSDQAHIDDAYRAGASAYLVKPFFTLDLIHAIKQSSLN